MLKDLFFFPRGNLFSDFCSFIYSDIIHRGNNLLSKPSLTGFNQDFSVTSSLPSSINLTRNYCIVHKSQQSAFDSFFKAKFGYVWQWLGSIE